MERYPDGINGEPWVMDKLSCHRNLSWDFVESHPDIKRKGFGIIEDYCPDDPMGCFDTEGTLICSICLEEVTNSKVTLITCPCLTCIVCV